MDLPRPFQKLLKSGTFCKVIMNLDGLKFIVQFNINYGSGTTHYS